MWTHSQTHGTRLRVPAIERAVAIMAAALVAACATTSIETTVKRAPPVPVFKSQRVGLAPIDASGRMEFETTYACAGGKAGKLGPIPEARLSDYRQKLDALVRSVLAKNGVATVGAGEAEQTLRISATFVERKVAELKRCDEKGSAAYGLHCLPDPVVNGKSTCGCVLVGDGKLDPANYDWVVYAMGDVDIEVVARLEAASGELIAEDSFPIFPDSMVPATTTDKCTHVRGHPTVVDQCLRTNMVGKTLKESTPDYEARFKAVLASAMAEENGGKWVHDALFPYEVQVSYTVFKVDEPEKVAEPAVEALREARFADAVALFEKGLGTVRQGGKLSSEARARFLYDYGVALLGAGQLPEAKAALEEAKSIQADERFDTALQEVDRQIRDRAQL